MRQLLTTVKSIISKQVMFEIHGRIDFICTSQFDCSCICSSLIFPELMICINQINDSTIKNQLTASKPYYLSDLIE